MFLIINCEPICTHSYCRCQFCRNGSPRRWAHSQDQTHRYARWQLCRWCYPINQRGSVEQRFSKALQGWRNQLLPTPSPGKVRRSTVWECTQPADLYNSSPAACAAWGSPDSHLIPTYCLFIVGIVRESPKKKATHFGCIKSQAIRAWVLYT
jgi:hypothetical protein